MLDFWTEIRCDLDNVFFIFTVANNTSRHCMKQISLFYTAKMWQENLKLLKILTWQPGSTWLQFFDRSLKGYTASNCALLTALSIKNYTSFNLLFSKALCWIGKKVFYFKIKNVY